MLESRQIEMGHARALLSVDDRAKQYEAARKVVKNGMSVRDTERLVRRILTQKSGSKQSAAKDTANADVRRLEVEVSEKLGARVKIDHTSKGSGKLVISYNSLDELDGILGHIK